MEKINNNYYVYVYMNPFVPYDKSVLGYYFTHTPYYIGKGKYDRWKHHINESIKYYNINIYKERKVRKILNELNNNITELYKTVLIIEYFDNLNTNLSYPKILGFFSPFKSTLISPHTLLNDCVAP
jgi:hypothetical protein